MIEIRKMKYAVLIFIIGLLVCAVGILFKITHWSIFGFSGNMMLSIGTILQIIGGLLLLYKVFFAKKHNDL